MVRYIGDIHANYQNWLGIIDGADESVQVGDYGIGFRQPPYAHFAPRNHRFIRGNHDNPARCFGEEHYIHDGTIEGDIMYVGGALSIDRSMRTEGVDWWRNEELSYEEFDTLIEKYADNKPKMMVTHECPDYVATCLMSHYRRTKYDDKSITRQAFDAMWDIHMPEIWIFGHWHLNYDQKIGDTRFICLNIEEFIDI
jgi:predicted phosphodiesterase